MARRVTLSDIFHAAADEHLWDGSPFSFNTEYSCWAIDHAAVELGAWRQANEAIQFAQRCGLPEEAEDAIERTFRSVRRRQDFRYAWLKFLALYAEELGV